LARVYDPFASETQETSAMVTFSVTNLNDSGAGSLRQALADAEAAAGADRIGFDAALAGGTVRLTTGRLVIASGAVTIDGDLDNDGDADITLSGDSNNDGIANAGDTGILRIAAGSDIGIGGLVLAGGYSVGSDGSASGIPGSSAGGAVENLGVLAIADSEFRGSHAKGGAGYIFNDFDGSNGGGAAGAILNAGALTVTNTQFANNRAAGGGGGNGGDGYTFENGSTGGRGGDAAAAILNLAGGMLGLSGARFLGGKAAGGAGGIGGNGGGHDFIGSYGDGGNGGSGGDASAGLINSGGISGSLSIQPGTATPGAGGPGGQGGSAGGYTGKDGAPGTAGASSGIFLGSGTGAAEITQLGTAAADAFTGTAGVDRYDGLGGDDTVFGRGANDILSGLAGNDVLDGGSGADAMAGGAGNDIYVIDDAGDAAAELAGAGYDTVRTTLAVQVLAANVERLYNDSAANFAGIGNALANTFYGNSGEDRFRDYAGGADRFSGGAGLDSMYYSGTAAAILDFATGVHGGSAAGDAFASVEKFFGSSTGNDQMTAGAARAIFNGQGGDDTLLGGANHDKLYGKAGTDTLSGGGGNDRLYGGAGNDTMAGGALRDDFIYSETVASGGFGADTITDWQDGVDVLRFAATVADDFADFTITGNGTASVTLALAAAPANTIVLNGAAPITITAADFLFF
jgi:RTX calcium-binding nonapeptide repeat (4 copies)